MTITLSQTTLCAKDQIILGPVDFKIERGRCYCVIGPNGAGKTSLLRLLAGVVDPDGGSITPRPTDPAVRAKQSFVFQRPVLLRRSVGENLAFVLRLSRVPRRTAVVRAREAADAFQLGRLLNQPARALSIGEQQKLAVARAVLTGPDLLLLDEPCASLDGGSTLVIERAIAKARDAGATVILSTHSMGQARRLADEIVFLHKGLVHEHGPAVDFFKAPRTPEAQAHLNGEIIP